MNRVIPITTIILVLALPVLGWWLIQRSLPSLSGWVTIPQLAAPVTLKLDNRSIPYIEATNDNDLYLAQGYAMARDRFFQMDILRRLAQGELSEIFGSSTLASDKLMRTVGINRIAQAEMSQLSPAVQQGLESFTQGVNAYIEERERHNNLPLEFMLLGYRPRVWEATDSLSILEYLSYLQDESWKLDDLRQRLSNKLGSAAAALFQEDWADTPHLTAQQNVTVSLLHQLQELRKQAVFPGPLEPSRGSNAWAVGGKLSSGGGALLACDYHASLTSPDIWYLCSLTSPGLHCAGATISGVPGVFIGRNDSVSWGNASLKADVQDLFLEEFSPQFPYQYRTSTGWQQASEITEEIPVRFSKSFVQKVLITTHGPVLLRNGNTGVCLSWSQDKTRQSALETIWKLNRAGGLPDVTESLKQFSGPSECFVCADRSGNIALQAAGCIPVRSNNGQGTGLTTGVDNTGQWGNFIGFANLPHLTNPPSGFVVAANQKLVAPNYGLLIGHQWCAPYRAFRIASQLSRLQNQHRPALPDLEELQSDQYAQLSSLIKQEIQQAITDVDSIDRGQLLALDQLQHWSGQLDSDSTAATIYEAFLHTLARRLIEPKLGESMTQEYLENWAAWPLFVEYYLRARPAYWLPPEERSHTVFILTTLSQALKQVRLAYGQADPHHWAYKSTHQAMFSDLITCGWSWLSPLFNIGPVPVGGDQDTVNANSISPQPGPLAFPCRSGPVLRMLVDMADNDKFYQAISLGQSGHHFSPFHKDQLSAWLNADPLPIAFSAQQVDRQMQSKLILSNR